jgi:colanic acid/amylovoran biosynthesis glycosyltransferase
MSGCVIGYFASEYPSISHTFIRREIEALRRRGLEIRTFSIRRAPSNAPLGEADRRELAATWTLQPVSLAATLRAHARALLRNPGRYFEALVLALRERPPGARALLWAFFYFAEGVILCDALRTAQVSHLHVHFANAAADVARVAAFVGDLPWSLTLHGTADVEYPSVLTLADKLGSARFAACASYFVRAQALRRLAPALWPRLTVVRCGVELTEASGTASTGGPIRLLCVGRLSTEKGHHGLIQALAELQSQVAPFVATLIGDGPLRRELEVRTQSLGLGDTVQLVGARSLEDVMKALGQSHLFVLASFMEGLPVSLMEAMAHGLPVVAPRVAGIPELVTDGQEGLLFTPSNWTELAAQLRRLLSDSDLRARLGAAGKRRIAEEFEIERAVEPLWKRFSGTADD